MIREGPCERGSSFYSTILTFSSLCFSFFFPPAFTFFLCGLPSTLASFCFTPSTASGSLIKLALQARINILPNFFLIEAVRENSRLEVRQVFLSFFFLSYHFFLFNWQYISSMKNLQRLGKTREREYLGCRLW